MPQTIKGRFNINTGVLTIQAPMYGATGPRGLRGRMTEIEQNPYEIWGWGQGLKPHKKLTYAQERNLRLSMPAINNCIDYIISRMISFPFKIVKEDGTRHNNFSQKRADNVTSILRGPNQFGTGWKGNLSMVADNLLERDLGIVQKEIYPITGSIKQIGIIDSIKIRPNPLNFQGDLSQPAYFEMDQMYTETIVNSYSRDEILWMNLKPQAGSFYGFSPIEYLDIMILMSLYASQHNLKMVDPVNERGGGIIWLGEGIGQEARRQFEERYKIMRFSDPSAPMFAAGGTSAPQFLDLRIKNDLDYSNLIKSLSEMACSSYGLSLQDIGIQTNGAGATAEINDAITQKTAIIPRMLMLEELFTNGIVKQAGGDDLKLIFVTKKEEAYETRVRAGVMALNRGGLRMNEFRNLIDEALEPYEGAMGDTPIVMLGSQVMRLEDAVKKAVDPMSGQIDLSKIGKPEQVNGKPDPAHRETNTKKDRGVDKNWSN